MEIGLFYPTNLWRTLWQTRFDFLLSAGRSGRIRTCDPIVPNKVLGLSPALGRAPIIEL